MALKSLETDTRWAAFATLYANDISGFARAVFGVTLSAQQEDLFTNVQLPRSRTSVASGHGCFALGTLLMRADGSPVAVEDVLPHDKLMGADGNSERHVQELRRGRSALYAFTYQDGSSHTFNESHTLCVSSNGGPLCAVTVEDWLASYNPDIEYACHRLISPLWSPPEYALVPIARVDHAGEGDYYGFTLDGDNQFLGADGTVLHNTGKTTGISMIVLWHLLCFPQSVTLLTANDMDQLKSTLWKEIATRVEQIKLGEHAWLYDYVEVLADASMRIRGAEKTWFVESKTANDKNANKMAGRHGKWFLVIGDEASTLSDSVITTLLGALTEEFNRMLLTSQPTRNAGFFWRTQNELSTDHGGEWAALVFSSFDSPWVSDKALKELWDTYDDDERRVRLLGIFPEDSSGLMMSLAVAQSMYARGRIIKDDEPYGYVVLADIASGEGLRDKSTCVIARVIGYGDYGPDARRVEVFAIPVVTNKIRSNQFSATLADEGSDYSNLTNAIDAGGLGVNVCQDLEDMQKTVHRIWWGNPCFQKKNQDRYMNLRAQAMHQAARAAKEGRLSILTNDHKRTMVGQSSRIPKAFTEKARIKVPPKGSKEWEGLGSPDLWDSVCFAFLENLSYMVAEGGTERPMGSAVALVEAADDMFADV